jgi:hypothetical protein
VRLGLAADAKDRGYGVRNGLKHRKPGTYDVHNQVCTRGTAATDYDIVAPLIKRSQR